MKGTLRRGFTHRPVLGSLKCPGPGGPPKKMCFSLESAVSSPLPNHANSGGWGGGPFGQFRFASAL